MIQLEKPYNQISSNEEVSTMVSNGSLKLTPPSKLQFSDQLTEFLDLIESCWNYDPNERQSFQVIEVFFESNYYFS